MVDVFFVPVIRLIIILSLLNRLEELLASENLYRGQEDYCNMEPNILYILPSYNIYGGTPKKTLDLMRHFGKKAALYVYSNDFSEFRSSFEKTGGKVYEGVFKRNVFKHIMALLEIIDRHRINIVQTQFSMGEMLGCLIKLFRPKVKLIVAFVGPFKPSLVSEYLNAFQYRYVDAFVYITEYVQTEKYAQFPMLRNKRGEIILNGSEKRIDSGEKVIQMRKWSLLDIAGLVEWKNIQVLIGAMNILINEKRKENIFLYIAGDGPMKDSLLRMIASYNLQDHIFLLGYQLNVGKLLDICDIFVHPAYAEGFGIVIPEAMFACKPIIVSNSGALPELIQHGKSGIIVDPHNAFDWAEAILKVIGDSSFAQNIANGAKVRAERNFSIFNFLTRYEKLYYSILSC